MKKAIFALLFLPAFLTSLRGQTLQDSFDLRADLATYRRINFRLDFDSILMFMPPTLFKIMPKPLMKNTLEQSFRSEDFSITIDSMTVSSVSPLIKREAYRAAFVRYRMVISFTFTNAEDSLFMQTLTGAFETEYGAENVRKNPAHPEKLAIVVPDNRMFALKEDSWDSWKFTEDKRDGEAGERMLMARIVPKPILDHFK